MVKARFHCTFYLNFYFLILLINAQLSFVPGLCSPHLLSLPPLFTSLLPSPQHPQSTVELPLEGSGAGCSGPAWPPPPASAGQAALEQTATLGLRRLAASRWPPSCCAKGSILWGLHRAGSHRDYHGRLIFNRVNLRLTKNQTNWLCSSAFTAFVFAV